MWTTSGNFSGKNVLCGADEQISRETREEKGTFCDGLVDSALVSFSPVSSQDDARQNGISFDEFARRGAYVKEIPSLFPSSRGKCCIPWTCVHVPLSTLVYANLQTRPSLSKYVYPFLLLDFFVFLNFWISGTEVFYRRANFRGIKVRLKFPLYTHGVFSLTLFNAV